MWKEIDYPNFSSAALEVWWCRSNFIPHFLACDNLSMQEFHLINLDKMALHKTKWCHDMKAISACLALCDGIHRLPVDSHSKGKGLMMRSFDGFFDVSLKPVEQTVELLVAWDAYVTSLRYNRAISCFGPFLLLIEKSCARSWAPSQCKDRLSQVWGFPC